MSITCKCGYQGPPQQLNFAESLYGFSEVCPTCNSTDYQVIIAQHTDADIQAIEMQKAQFLNSIHK